MNLIFGRHNLSICCTTHRGLSIIKMSQFWSLEMWSIKEETKTGGPASCPHCVVQWLCQGVSHNWQNRVYSVMSDQVVCCVALVSHRQDTWLVDEAWHRVRQQKRWAGLNFRHQTSLSLAASMSAAAGPRDILQKMNGKPCVFITASDLVWTQP